MAEIISKIMSDGRLATVIELTFARARITIGPANQPFYDDGW